MDNQTFIGTSSGFIDLLIGGRYDWADFGFGFSPASFAEANGPFDPAGNARARRFGPTGALAVILRRV
jgi:hypothetical protein